MNDDDGDEVGEDDGQDDDFYGDYFPMDDRDIQEETLAYNLQLAELARDSSLRNKTAALLAYDLLTSNLFYPDTVAYNTVLKALAKTSSFYNKHAAPLAQELLEEMEELHAQQLKEHREWYERLEKGEPQDLMSSEELSRGPPRVRVKPNVRSYSTVMDAWGKQTNPQAAQTAELVLEQLQKRYAETKDVALRPNVISYNTIINAWAKANARLEGAERCEALLKEMHDPDVISYNAVLHAWARSGSPEAGERAEQILRSMTQPNKNFGNNKKQSKIVKPNARTYTTTMDAWSRCFFHCEDSARRAHALLLELEQLAAKGDESLKPNFVSYSTVVNAYALSKSEPLKAHKAFGLLQKMHRLGRTDPTVRPNRVTYNAVLNACATSNPKTVQNEMEEFASQKQQNSNDPSEKDTTASSNSINELPTLPDLVRTLYGQLVLQGEEDDDEDYGNRRYRNRNSSLRPDHFTFGTVLKAVANLFWGEPDQVEFGKQVFLEACRRGQVSFGVLSQLRQAMPAEVYRDLLPSKATSGELPDALMNYIPKEWTRNVREENRRRQNHHHPHRYS